MKKILQYVGIAIVVLVVIGSLYLVTILLPILLYTESKCKDAGYKGGDITFFLSRSCLKGDGTSVEFARRNTK